MQPTILYAYDALCGWCYGFSPVVKELHARWHDRFEFQVRSGGMVRGARVAPIRQMADYIRQSYPRVEQTTGVRFGEAFLDGLLAEGDYVSDSEPPARALATLRSHRPEAEVAFAHALQDAFYLHGHDLNDPSTYRRLATTFELDADGFVADMQTERTKRAVLREFDELSALGVRGFPSLLLHDGEQYYLLAHGYRSAEELNAIIGEVATQWSV
ncbi:MAG: DsbA family protein [Catalinimonas sp.]